MTTPTRTEPRRRRPSLRSYLAGLLVLFVVAAGVTATYERSRSMSDARREVEERMEFLAELAADDINDAVTDMQSQVEQLAANPSVPSIFANAAGCTLTFGGAGPFEVGHFHLVDRDGLVVCSSDELPATSAYAGESWLRVEEPLVIGSVDAATGQRSLRASAPVGDLGAAVVFARLDAVADALAEFYGSAFDATFEVIGPGGAPVSGEVNDNAIARSANITRLGWTVSAGVDETAALAAANDAQRRTLGLTVGALAAVMLATFAAYRGLARPIAGLSATVRAAMRGEHPGGVTGSGPEEVVSLAEDFTTLTGDMAIELEHRRRAEQDARASAESYRLIFEGNPQPMWVYDVEDGRLVEVNDAMAQRFGWSQDELRNKTVDDLCAPEAPRFTEAITERGRLDRSGPWRLVACGGEEIDCEITSDELLLNGRPSRLVIAEDVTAAQRNQRLLRQAERMGSLGQLAGGMAHDFNNILAVMLNYTDFVAEEVTAAAERDPDRWQPVLLDVEQVSTAGTRAAALTHQLLAFARGEPPNTGAVDLNDVAGGLEQMLHRTISKQIALEVSLAPASAIVHADRGQLEQVIVNLAVNARDAMPNGGRLSIEIRNIDVDEHHAASRPEIHIGRYVRLRVSDTGVGMPPEVRDHVFEPFFTTKHRGSGTGLGLATVYGIVNRAGGTIHVYSEPGHGTSFTIMLPATSEPLAAEAPTWPQPSGGGTETILVVEDDDDLRQVAERVLTRHGYTVLGAGDGDSALAVAAERLGEIDLVLTDVVMPGMLGNELAVRLREAQPHIRILLMSGYAPPVLHAGGNLAVGAPLLDKPFSAATLIAKVRAVLDAPTS